MAKVKNLIKADSSEKMLKLIGSLIFEGYIRGVTPKWEIEVTKDGEIVELDDESKDYGELLSAIGSLVNQGYTSGGVSEVSGIEGSVCFYINLR